LSLRLPALTALVYVNECSLFLQGANSIMPPAVPA
jgi:hypothetical protein